MVHLKPLIVVLNHVKSKGTLHSCDLREEAPNVCDLKGIRDREHWLHLLLKLVT